MESPLPPVPPAPDTAVLHTRTGSHPLRIRLADGFWSRFRGLMFASTLAPYDALLITRCPSVHTAFMRITIDVVYLNANGQVLRCVTGLKPWRASIGALRNVAGRRHGRPAHCLELPAGSIVALAIEPGDRLVHSALSPNDGMLVASTERAPDTRQRGAAMIEFIVVGPLLTLIGLAILQYGQLFFAKNQINYATFMAVRAGSTEHASVDAIRNAYARNLLALYGGGTTSAELIASIARAAASDVELQLLNPTKESYDDWNDPVLERKYGARAIPNSGLAFRDLDRIGTASGQNLQDANLIKLRVMHGYKPGVPLVQSIYTRYLKWMDTGDDPRYTAMVESGLVPIVAHATVQMQSDPVEGTVVSSPGPGNGGTPTDPGDPPTNGTPPPSCQTAGCTVPPGSTPPACDPFTDPNGCRLPGCQAGDPRCDPICNSGRACCLPARRTGDR